MRPRTFIALLLLCIGATELRAQSTVPPLDITHLHEPRALDSTWLVQAGDNPAFASPAFDDSQWTPFDPYGPINAIYGKLQPNILWYRLHVTVDPEQHHLSLSEWQIERAFEIYVNGERILASGQVQPFRPYTTVARPIARIPDRMVATGSLLIALRIHISPPEWGNGVNNPGYYANNLTIGSYDTLVHDNWLTIIGENSLRWLDHLLLICLGFVAIVLFASQRNQSTYLWIAGVGVLTLVETPEPIIVAFRNIPASWEVANDLTRLASPFLWAGLYFSFVHQRIGWRWRVFLVICGIGNALSAVNLSLSIAPDWQLLENLPYIVLLSVILPIVLALHWRRGSREAGILLVPAVLFSLYIYADVAFAALFRLSAWRQFALRGLNLIDNYPLGPFRLSLDSGSGILCTLSLAVIILLRSITMSRRQALIDSELEAARSVQQVLVPEHTGHLPGFAVASVYLPAQQVGGDFFQIIPDDSGGLLLVIGDVAGKGLPAAMLVSVLVGAIRATADYSRDPVQILAKLNERLVGRVDGALSTALAVHITDEGWVTLANAGHLPPYLDGKEVELPGALPLGVAPGISYECSSFALEPGSRLTFYSDGVVEAQNAAGELLGFERSRELSQRPAADIAAAAKAYGQLDDITVLTIERTPIPALA